MKTKAHALPEMKTKQSPQRLLQGLPVGWELRGDSVEQPVSGSHARCCTTLEMLIPTTRTHEHADAQKEVTNNCAVSKLPAENKYPFARAFPKAQADLHSKSSSLKEHFLIERQLTDQIPNQIPLHRPLKTLQCIVQTSAKSKLPSPAPSSVSKPI